MHHILSALIEMIGSFRINSKHGYGSWKPVSLDLVSSLRNSKRRLDQCSLAFINLFWIGVSLEGHWSCIGVQKVVPRLLQWRLYSCDTQWLCTSHPYCLNWNVCNRGDTHYGIKADSKQGSQWIGWLPGSSRINSEHGYGFRNPASIDLVTL